MVTRNDNVGDEPDGYHSVVILFCGCKPDHTSSGLHFVWFTSPKQNDNRIKLIWFINSQITNVIIHPPILFKLSN